MPSPRLYESSIYVSLKKLRGKLYDMQYRMPKSARAIYAAPMLRLSAETIKHFIIAYTVPKRREDEVLEALGYFGALRCDIEHLFQHDIVQFRKRRPENALPESEDPAAYASTRKLEILRLVAKVDEDMDKWRASLAKGKSALAPPRHIDY